MIACSLQPAPPNPSLLSGSQLQARWLPRWLGSTLESPRPCTMGIPSGVKLDLGKASDRSPRPAS